MKKIEIEKLQKVTDRMLPFDIGRICLVCILGQYCNIHAGSEHQFFKHYSWQKIVQSHVFRKLQVIFLLTFKSANDECSYYYFDVFHIFRNELQKHVDDKLKRGPMCSGNWSNVHDYYLPTLTKSPWMSCY